MSVMGGWGMVRTLPCALALYSLLSIIAWPWPGAVGATSCSGFFVTAEEDIVADAVVGWLV